MAERKTRAKRKAPPTVEAQVREVEEYPKVSLTVTGFAEPIHEENMECVLVVVPTPTGFTVHAHGLSSEMGKMGLAVMDFLEKIQMMGPVLMQHMADQMMNQNRGQLEEQVIYRKAGDPPPPGMEELLQQGGVEMLFGAALSRAQEGEDDGDPGDWN